MTYTDPIGYCNCRGLGHGKWSSLSTSFLFSKMWDTGIHIPVLLYLEHIFLANYNHREPKLKRTSRKFDQNCSYHFGWWKYDLLRLVGWNMLFQAQSRKAWACDVCGTSRLCCRTLLNLPMQMFNPPVAIKKGRRLVCSKHFVRGIEHK